ncbi:EutN/CcmL family microcompartment protein [bacterium]|nr:EutN/CcmL family microcompartment protein [bacterium]RQV97751.1 MAG: ethanolamine utilization protein EutN [bacterium]
MQFGQVIGNIVSTQKTGHIQGIRLLVVRHLDENLKKTSKVVACTDTVNTKAGDIVLLCSSSSARMTSITKGVCTDHSIVAVVEMISSQKKNVYHRQ